MNSKYNQSIEIFDTHAIFYVDYCKVKNIIPEHSAIYTIKTVPELCNASGYVDYGVLITMIDGLTSYSQIFISKIHKKRSLSVNLNVKVFRQIESDKEYEMFVKVYSESKKYTCFKCQIYDSEGRLACLATHVKRNLKPKF
jgi:predicted transcriptional regulator